MFMVLWDFVIVPLRAIRDGANVIVHCTNTGWAIGRVRSVIVMHDTMVLDHPTYFGRAFRWYARFAFGLSARSARLIVTPSEHSKRQILNRWPGATVKVIPWPVELGPSDEDRQQRSRRVLVVASADRHKRLPLAVAVVEAARARSGEDLGLDLVVRSGNDDAALAAAVLGRESWIRVHRSVSETALSDLYRRALCVLVTSIDEGFCLPAVEAAVHTTPVAHANPGALPEVAPLDDEHLGTDMSDDELLVLRLIDLLDDFTAQRAADRLRQHVLAHFSTSRVSSAWLHAIESVR
jgi:glycosyltransferase involved in cell wall biosynthesis